MGWFKKLKKKLSIKNVLKGIKKVSKFIPGGQLIKKGIEEGQKAYEKLKKKPAKKKPGQVEVTTPQITLVDEPKFDSKNLIPIAVGILAIFFMSKQ